MSTRLRMIADAATRLFLRQGYAKTQISHIAKAAGVSVGTIYLDFAGKKEISQFILKCTIDPGFIDSEFKKPITADQFVDLDDEIVALFNETEKAFARHLEHDLDAYSFEALISDSFDIFARYAVGFLFIEKNRFDFISLTELYMAYRGRFFTTMTRYIQAYIERGTIRKLENIELTATLIIETLSWWAMDIHFASFQIQNVPIELAKFVCMDNIVTAYIRS